MWYEGKEKKRKLRISENFVNRSFLLWSQNNYQWKPQTGSFFFFFQKHFLFNETKLCSSFKCDWILTKQILSVRLELVSKNSGGLITPRLLASLQMKKKKEKARYFCHFKNCVLFCCLFYSVRSASAFVKPYESSFLDFLHKHRKICSSVLLFSVMKD